MASQSGSAWQRITKQNLAVMVEGLQGTFGSTLGGRPTGFAELSYPEF